MATDTEQIGIPMVAGREYVIESPWDFCKVPDDRLDLCLREFAVAVRMSRDSIALIDTIAASKGAPKGMFKMVDAFRWIDDDLGEVEITFSVPEPSAPDAKPETPPVSPIDND